jgi:hypothetical protein
MTGTLTNGQATVTGLASTAGIGVGMMVTASIAGVPAGTTVTQINSGTQVTLSGNFTGTTGSATINFGVTTLGTNKVLVSAGGGITLVNGTNTITHTLAGWLGVGTTVGVAELSTRATWNQ